MVSKSVRRRRAAKRSSNTPTAVSGGGRQKNVSAFAKCALNPFSGVGMSSGVPDRFDGNVVLFENTTLKNYKFTSDEDVVFMFLPSFGKNLFICNVSSNGAVDLTDSIGVDATVDTDDAYKFAAFRTISLGARITYIGKPLDASGVIFATQFKLRLGPPIDCKITDGLTEDGFEHVGVTKTEQAPARIFDPFSTDISDIMSSPDSSMVRLSGGCILVAKHSSGDSWDFSDIWEDDSYLTDIAVTASNPTLKPTDLLGGWGKKLKGLDHNSYGVLARVNGQQNGTHLIIEVKHCMEAIPSLNHGVYRTLARPSAKRDPSAIDMVVDVQRNLPVAVEGGVTAWGSVISKAISGIDVASLVRRVGAMALGPGISAIERLLF